MSGVILLFLGTVFHWEQPPATLEASNLHPSLKRVCQKRDSIRSGSIDVRQVLRTEQGESFSVARISFDGARIRMDVLDSAEKRFIESEKQTKVREVQEVVVWDGKHLLYRNYEPSSFPFQLRSIDESSMFFFHPALLGLPPGRAQRRSEIAARFDSEWLAESSVSTGSTMETRLVTGVLPDGSTQQLKLITGRESGDSVLSFELTEKTSFGDIFQVCGKSDLELIQGFWYPRRFTLEQRKNDKWDWTLEYELFDVRFNMSIAPHMFTWNGLGIREGMPIIRSALAITDGSQSEQERAFRFKNSE